MPQMPEQTGNTGNETVYQLRRRKTGAAKKRHPSRFGVGHYLTIPCETGKPDRIAPLYLVELNSLGGVERGYWQCEQCAAIYHTRKAWAKHAGMVSNIMGKCPGG